MKKRRIFPLLLPLLAGAAFFIVSCVSAPEPKLPPKKADEKALRAAVQKMTVRQLAGQMIVCGFTGTELSPEFKAFLKKYLKYYFGQKIKNLL